LIRDDSSKNRESFAVKVDKAAAAKIKSESFVGVEFTFLGQIESGVIQGEDGKVLAIDINKNNIATYGLKWPINFRDQVTTPP
jgi:predicted regulator of Ras-like GTPase activity (Roadblock/LC7/MglB family)